jgi:hypothetical protein
MVQRRLLHNQRRVGEGITIACGIARAAVGAVLGIPFVAYGGLCVAGLGVVSIFWK